MVVFVIAVFAVVNESFAWSVFVWQTSLVATLRKMDFRAVCACGQNALFEGRVSPTFFLSCAILTQGKNRQLVRCVDWSGESRLRRAAILWSRIIIVVAYGFSQSSGRIPSGGARDSCNDLGRRQIFVLFVNGSKRRHPERGSYW